MKLLSIIVPVYNGEKYLPQCIESILSQKYSDFELIIIDDGSTDSSFEICNEFAKKDSRILVHHKENEGLVAARKTGVSISTGQYIGFVDCDDYVDKNMYSDLMSATEGKFPDIVSGGIIIDYITKSKAEYNNFPNGFYNKIKLENYIIPHMLISSGFVKYGILPGVVTKVFKRSVLEKALPNVDNSITIGEDVAITAYSVMNAESVSIIDSASYHYIQYDDSMVRKFNPGQLTKISNLYSCISKIENGDYQRQVSLYMCFLLFIAVVDCIKKSGYDNKKMKAAINDILDSELAVTVLKKADISGLSFKDKSKVLLLKYRLIGLLQLFI